MKTKITPDRKGSALAKRFRIDCILLSAICLVAAVGCLLSDGYADLFPSLLGAAIALAFLGALFRILGCLAYDLETIAATKMVDYTEDDEQQPRD